MVEVPDSGIHLPTAVATVSAPVLHRESSGGRRGGADDQGEEDDSDGDGADDGEGESQQMSGQALLALLLVLKSFLKHLSSLRGGGRFVEVWRQVSEQMSQ